MALTYVSPMRREWVTVNADLSLNGTINQIATTITVNDASALPTSNSFRILIEDELIECLGTTGNDIDVAQRGADGTTGATHTDGTVVQVVTTPNSLEKIGFEHGFWANPFAAARYYPDNVHRDENALDITTANWTWVNQGTAAVADSNAGGMYFTVQSATWPDLKMLVRTAPSTPYRFIARAHFGHRYSAPGVGSSTIVLGWRQSSTGEIACMGIRPDYAAAYWHFDDPTTYNSNVDSAQNGFYGNVPVWIMAIDDGTNRSVRLSHNGANWTRLDSAYWQEGRTNFMTPDQIMLGCSSASGTNNEVFHFSSIIIEEY